jgi:hypothetical protein
MTSRFHHAHNALSLFRSVGLTSNVNRLLLTSILVLFLALSCIDSNQWISAQPFTGLRVVVHVFSDPREPPEPPELANITVYDNDTNYRESKNLTIGPDGSGIVEFRAPFDVIRVFEPIHVNAESNSSNCGKASGYNHPEYVSEYIDLYLMHCDLTR